MRTLAAVALLGAAACTTPYQRMGFAGGYRDSLAAPGINRIEVRGNAFTSIEQLEAYFHRRASEICNGNKYDWRMDSGASNDPSTWTARQVGRSVQVTETPGFRKGWVTGLVACEDRGMTVATKATQVPSDKVQVIEVRSGRVAAVSADVAFSKVPSSSRFAFVTDGRVAAVTPEGHRVFVDVAKIEAAKTLGYRFLADSELENGVNENEAAATTGDNSPGANDTNR
ncbi:hypothetical protein MYSTI_02125 [Myxococcus stipitatus DSM 14675]|uniref:Lipoprotein n=1 Tax=Myxococcus stipitatus (strain DSM 14675 / JCM 12634 / Mx s8) TaxID=1278073 RepID=L7U7C7_MYXSD|nr:hypothetical protein [Myxococcus stipitatus]AGC43452.1 hypothetical protein MYSTI_02125 [Myxococcus stipitatus DSM 14675]